MRVRVRVRVRHRVEHVLEDGGAHRGHREVLVDVQALEEGVGVRLPCRRVCLAPRGRQQHEGRLVAAARLGLLKQHAAREPADLVRV